MTGHEQIERVAGDALTATGAVTAPYWLTHFNAVVQEVMLIGGLFLLALRLAIAWREWQDRRRKRLDL